MCPRENSSGSYEENLIISREFCNSSVWCLDFQTRMLLTPERVLEDVSQDHARKTVSPVQGFSSVQVLVGFLWPYDDIHSSRF